MKFDNTPFTMTDDRTVFEIADSLGIANKLTDPSRLSGNVGFLSTKRHSTHWLLFLRYHGFEKEEDNGLALYAWPKSQYTIDVMETQLRGCIEDMGGEFKGRITYD